MSKTRRKRGGLWNPFGKLQDTNNETEGINNKLNDINNYHQTILYKIEYYPRYQSIQNILLKIQKYFNEEKFFKLFNKFSNIEKQEDKIDFLLRNKNTIDNFYNIIKPIFEQFQTIYKRIVEKEKQERNELDAINLSIKIDQILKRYHNIKKILDENRNDLKYFDDSINKLNTQFNTEEFDNIVDTYDKFSGLQIRERNDYILNNKETINKYDNITNLILNEVIEIDKNIQRNRIKNSTYNYYADIYGNTPSYTSSDNNKEENYSHQQYFFTGGIGARKTKRNKLKRQTRRRKQ